jgi:hypothetical protein
MYKDEFESVFSFDLENIHYLSIEFKVADVLC